jgi:hypothetical protein
METIGKQEKTGESKGNAGESRRKQGKEVIGGKSKK